MSSRNEYLMIKGAISELTAEEQAKISEAKQELNALLQKYDDMGKLAMALAAYELELYGKVQE